MTHCNCKQMGSDTQLLIEQSNSTLLDRYKRSVKFKSCPNIVTPVIFVYSSIYLKCLIIRKMPATFFKTPLRTLLAVWDRPSQQEASIEQSFNCNWKYLCMFIALVGSPFYILSWLVIQKPSFGYSGKLLGETPALPAHIRPTTFALETIRTKSFCRIGPRKRPYHEDSRGMESCRIKKLQLISIIYFFTRTPHISQAFNGCCSCC